MIIYSEYFLHMSFGGNVTQTSTFHPWDPPFNIDKISNTEKNYI